MKTLSEIKKVLKEHKLVIKKRFGVKEIGVFGSYVHGKPKKKSDLDILVEFERGYKTFDNYMKLKFYLVEILDRKIDLVIKEALREEIKEYVMPEIVYV